jgi:mitogen-activated protein kinase 1/3
VEDALAHPYLEAYVRVFELGVQLHSLTGPSKLQHDPDDEPVAPPLDPEFFEFDRQSNLHDDVGYMLTCLSCSIVHKDDISREQLKELLYEEIMSFRPAPIT